MGNLLPDPEAFLYKYSSSHLRIATTFLKKETRLWAESGNMTQPEALLLSQLHLPLLAPAPPHQAVLEWGQKEKQAEAGILLLVWGGSACSEQK